MALITRQQREEAENLIYKVFDAAEDGTHMNSDYYRGIFSKMNDDQFYNFFKSKRLPLRFHYEIFKVEPKMDTVIAAFKCLTNGAKLIHKVNLPHVYRDSKGRPVQSQECLVIHVHIKRMKQNVIDKTHVALNTEKRDMRTGLLSGHDKGARESDREFEGLGAFGLDFTMDEMSRARADSLRAANEMVSVIMSKGSVSDKDITVAKEDNLSKNMVNVYLLGAGIHSNLIDTEYMTPYTARNKQLGYTREV